jgi:hypothetical protein
LKFEEKQTTSVEQLGRFESTQHCRTHLSVSAASPCDGLDGEGTYVCTLLYIQLHRFGDQRSSGVSGICRRKADAWHVAGIVFDLGLTSRTSTRHQLFHRIASRNIHHEKVFTIGKETE